MRSEGHDILGSDGPELRLVFRAAPEFEAHIRDIERREGGTIGPFEVMSELAQWVRSRSDIELTKQIFDVARVLYEDPYLQLGTDLAAEFLEAMRVDPPAPLQSMLSASDNWTVYVPRSDEPPPKR